MAMKKGRMDQTGTDPRTLTIGGTRDSRTSLRVIDHKFVIGKEEFYPFVAEMHYYRIPKRHWSVCFERIRKAEFRIISTSVPWNLHEARQGDFDFAGASDQAKDLIVFLELCREFGFKILLRPGPWIASEWIRGGIPDFATKHPETVAQDFEGRPIMADPGAGVKPSPLPSYLSGRFQILLKNYYSVFAEVVKNYIYPRGPVFMIELDHETSFGGHFAPFSADYNQQGTLTAYPRFLEEKFGTIDKLNKVYKGRVKNFGEVTPPTSYDGKSLQDMRKALDWIEFREWVVNRYNESVAELLSQTEISALFARSLAFDGPYSFPDVAGARTGGRVVFTVNVGWETPFSDTVRRARTVAGWQPTGFCTNLSVGNRHQTPELGRLSRPITAADTKRLLVTSLAAGLKGFNFHMFVGREHWYDAALEADGAILPSFDVIRDAVTQLLRVRYETMRDFAGVALVQYRPYLRARTLGAGLHDYLGDLVGVDLNDTAADLAGLGYDYRIFDLTVPNRLDEYGTLIVPIGEFMDAAAQERLLTLIQNGAHAILFGLVPTLDDSFEKCEILAKGIGMRTTAKPAIAQVEAGKRRFVSETLGVVHRMPNSASRLAKEGARVLCASARCGKGLATVLTFSPGSRFAPGKLSFLQDLLDSGKLTTPVKCSDPTVHAVVHAHAKGALLMLYDTAETTGVGGGAETAHGSRPIIVSLDLKAVGLNAKTVALTDLLGTDSMRVPAKDLGAGISIRLGRGDSRLYYVEKKA